MIKTEFGIIENFDPKEDYKTRSPEKYRCVAIDGDLYLNDWWDVLLQMDTYNVYDAGILQAQKALSRWGNTVIPPVALPQFLEVVRADRRCRQDPGLLALAELIREAIESDKHMIHYGACVPRKVRIFGESII